MTDAEISRRLAVAIGWPRVVTLIPTNVVLVSESAGMPASWRGFDYRDQDVIYPIAERYRVMTVGTTGPAGDFYARTNSPYGEAWADTLYKAVALAVIDAHDRQQRGKQK